MNYRNQIRGCKRIVVKVGTSTLIYDNGNINLTRIEKLTRVLSDLMNSGREIVLVSSGAIGVGVNKLKLKEKPKSIKEKQAVAAVGQCELMYIYSKLFGEYSHVVGQILLTRDVVEDNHIRENVVNTFETLIKNGIIPIVNENDTVSIDIYHSKKRLILLQKEQKFKAYKNSRRNYTNTRRLCRWCRKFSWDWRDGYKINSSKKSYKFRMKYDIS